MSKPYQQHDPIADRGKAQPQPKQPTRYGYYRGGSGPQRKRGARWDAFCYWVGITRRYIDPFQFLRGIW